MGKEANYNNTRSQESWLRGIMNYFARHRDECNALYDYLNTLEQLAETKEETRLIKVLNMTRPWSEEQLQMLDEKGPDMLRRLYKEIREYEERKERERAEQEAAWWERWRKRGYPNGPIFRTATA